MKTETSLLHDCLIS